MTLRFQPFAGPIPGPEEVEIMAKELRENPGKWALIGSCSTPGAARQRAYAIRKGRQKGFEPAGAFRAESHTMLGQYVVYAVYVGS